MSGVKSEKWPAGAYIHILNKGVIPNLQHEGFVVVVGPFVSKCLHTQTQVHKGNGCTSVMRKNLRRPRTTHLFELVLKQFVN